MGIVALDAFQPCLLTLSGVPVAVRPTVRTMLPIAVDRPVTLRTHKLWFGPEDFIAEIVDKGIAIGPVVTVEAMRVDAVLQINLRVLRQRAVGLFG